MVYRRGCVVISEYYFKNCWKKKKVWVFFYYFIWVRFMKINKVLILKCVYYVEVWWLFFFIFEFVLLLYLGVFGENFLNLYGVFLYMLLKVFKELKFIWVKKI